MKERGVSKFFVLGFVMFFVLIGVLIFFWLIGGDDLDYDSSVELKIKNVSSVGNNLYVSVEKGEGEDIIGVRFEVVDIYNNVQVVEENVTWDDLSEKEFLVLSGVDISKIAKVKISPRYGKGGKLGRVSDEYEVWRGNSGKKDSSSGNGEDSSDSGSSSGGSSGGGSSSSDSSSGDSSDSGSVDNESSPGDEDNNIERGDDSGYWWNSGENDVFDGDTWYVRPYGHDYGIKDGSSYTDAWAGFGGIDWDKIKPGDKLYVCGRHDAGYRNKDSGISVKKNGTAEDYIIISGDCPGDPGVIWTSGDTLYSGADWNGPDQYGAYWIHKISGLSQFQGFEDEIRLITRNADPDSTWLPGSYYHNSTSRWIYYKPISGAASDHLMYACAWVSSIDLNNIHYVKVEDLETNAGSSGVSISYGSSNVVLKNLKMRYHSTGVNFIAKYGNIYNVTIDGCEIRDCGDGIYLTADPNNETSQNIIIRNNHIYNIDQEDFYGKPDRHAIGIQGGTVLIENNNIHHGGGSAVLFYVRSENQWMSGNVVRYNKIHDIFALKNGVDWQQSCLVASGNNGLDPETNKNNEMYGNIIYNCERGGIIIKGGKPAEGFTWKVYNNVIYGARFNFVISDAFHFDDTKTGLIFKNNILMNPIEQQIAHTYDAAKGDFSGVVIDDNLYYPDGDGLFEWKNVYYDYDDWKVASGQDGDSVGIANPKFVNPSAYNFKLQIGSPAIDAGVDMGLSQDFVGVSVPQGSAPDLGVYEYI